MPKSKLNPATPRVKHEPCIHDYHYTVSDAALLVGVPATWVWAWLLNGHLTSKTYGKGIWVCWSDVQELFLNYRAVWDAYYATRDPLVNAEAVKQALERWPDLAECIHFRRSGRSRKLYPLEEEVA